MNNNNDNNNEIGSILVNQARSTYGYSIPYPLSIPTTHKSFVIRAVSTNSSIHTFKYTLRAYLSCDKQQEQEGTVSPFRRNFVTFGYGGFLVPAIESRNTGWQQTRRKEEKSWFTGEIFLQSRDVSAARGEGRGLIERSKGEGSGSTKWSTIIRSAGENADVPFLIYPRALMSANLRQLNFLAETSPSSGRKPFSHVRFQRLREDFWDREKKMFSF